MIRIVGIIVFLISATFFYAQDHTISIYNIPAEKVYLQLDRTGYTTDQTIWFKAIVSDASTHRPSVLSGVLYVELIAPDEKIVERKLLKMVSGSGNSFFELHDNLIEGNYLLRAYTEWNKNFGADFIYEEYINIFSSVGEYSESPINEVSLVEKDSSKFWLVARLKSDFFDDNRKHKLNAYLDIDGKKDTLSLKLKNDDKPFLDYPVPSHTHLVAMTLETEDKKKYHKTISLNSELLDVQFFPESGVMVDSLSTKIGFKVLNDKGVGIAVEGNIYNDDNQFITAFKSNDLGMGVFFINPKVGTYYHAKIEGSENKTLVKYPLPKVDQSGTVLSVLNANKNIALSVSSNYQISDSIFIKVQHRGKDIFLIEGKLDGGRLLTSVPKNKFPEGILVFTLLNNEEQPLVQRLYFNEILDARLQIALSSKKKIYSPREKATLEIAVANSTGEPVNGNLSVLVIDRAVLEAKTGGNNIISYFLMDSELKGEIENPSYYFDSNNKNRWNDLDALMMTQGWRKYVFHSPDTLQYNPETRLNLRGSVYSINSKKRRKEVNLKLLTFGKKRTFQEYITDSLGRFNFEVDDEYGAPVEILVQSANSNGRNKNYHISLDEKKPPKITFDHMKSIRDLDSIIYAQVKAERDHRVIEDSFEMFNGITHLEEVVVEANRLTPQRKIVLDTYGPADVVIPGNEILEKEKKWSYGLYSVLLFNYPKEISIEQFSDGFMLAHINGGGMTLVVIDGIPVVDYNYNLIPRIPPSEVKSVELLKFAKNFNSLYLEVFPGASVASIPPVGSVIAIYTHAGKGINSIDKPIGIVKSTIPVFSPEREFYSPRYDKPAMVELKKPDLRSLIHWVPEIKFSISDTTSIEFYNPDIPGEKLILIEAISEDGQLGYQEMIYEVVEAK